MIDDEKKSNKVVSMRNLQVLASSFGIFAYWTLLSPVISSVFSGEHLQILFPVSLMSITLGVLSSFLTLKLLTPQFYLKYIFPLSLLSVPIALYLVSYFQQNMDSRLLNNLGQTSFQNLEMLLSKSHFVFQILIFISLGAPFFFYGLYLAISFKKAKKSNLISFYAFELFGILLGTAFVYVLLEETSFNFVLSSIFISFSVAALLNVSRHSRWLGGFLLLPLFIQYNYSQCFEPQRDLNWSARDFNKIYKTQELERGWTTYAKVQTLAQTVNTKYERRLISIGDGTGIARIYSLLDGHVEIARSEPDYIATALEPKSVLVLFAGGGRDLLNINKYLENLTSLVGVEINPLVVKQAIRIKPSPLKNLLEKDHISMIVNEGRNFLQKDQNQFDLILFSWSGATIAHFSGAVLHTTQFLFTQEAMELAYNKLNPGGHLVIFGASKINLILSFIKTFEKHGKSPSQFKMSAVLVGSTNPSDPTIFTGWDNYGLVVKKGPWEAAEVTKLNKVLIKNSQEIKLSPFGMTSHHFMPIKEMLDKNSFLTARNYINQLTGNKLFFTSHKDVNPFVYNVYPPKDVLSFSYPLASIKTFLNFKTDDLRKLLLGGIFLLVLIVLVQFVFLRSFGTKNYFVHAEAGLQGLLLGALSSGFVILVTYKALLLYGNPTKSLVLSQVCASLASFIGVLVYNSRFKQYLKVLLLGGLFSCFLIWLGLNLPTLFIHDYEYLSEIYYVASFSPLLILFSYLFSHYFKRIKSMKNNAINAYFSLNLLGASLSSVFIPVCVENHGTSDTSTFLCILSILSLSIFICMSTVTLKYSRFSEV